MPANLAKDQLLLLIRPLRIGYQNIPKVATTSMFTWLYQAHGEVFQEHPNHMRKFFKTRYTCTSLEEIRQARGHYLRVALTRDPVRRFLSLYGNRVVAKRDLGTESTRSQPLEAAGLLPDPQIEYLIEHLDAYLANSPALAHHAQRQTELLGPDLSVYDHLLDISQSGRLIDLIRQYWTEHGLSDALSNTDSHLPRLQTGGPRIGLDGISRRSFDRLLEHYQADYDAIPTLDQQSIKQQFLRDKGGSQLFYFKFPPAPAELVTRLGAIVGARHVLTGDRDTRRFRRGYRYGEGKVLTVVRPGTLLEQWQVFKLCIESGRVVIMQAANTGLNGGSTPYGNGYDREIVLINTMRINRIDLLDAGKQVLCQAGSTLHQLETLIRPLGREPHSVIGSTTIGASIVGGVCNNSGGALLRRGPAFTQLALYAQVGEDGAVNLVNHLGVHLGDKPEEILSRLDRGEYTEADVEAGTGKLASDPDYATLVRDNDAALPARYNNDPRLLHEASGSAGKLCVFAVRLDTFPTSGPSKTFYIGSNDHMELTKIRRHILANFKSLPVAGEYLNQDAYRIAQKYGKDLYLFLKHVGSHRIAAAFGLKGRFDAITRRLRLGASVSDRLLQFLTRLLPNHLPPRMNDFADRYEHHLLLRMDGDGIAEARDYLRSIFPSTVGNYFECDEAEADAAFRNRYAIGGGEVRYRVIHADKVENIVALDMALPRNVLDWRESLPPELEPMVAGRIRCGHFFCHVFHYDYIIKNGHDWLDLERRIVSWLDDRGIELPSEHNVGHLYRAKPVLADFYRSLDPTNSLNPGIGQTSKRRNWR